MMGPFSAVWFVFSVIWDALWAAYSVIYFLQSNLLPFVFTILAFLLPLCLFAKSKLRKSKKSVIFADADSIISEICKIIPASMRNGWQLIRVLKGMRLWQQVAENLSRDVPVITGSLCLDCKPKYALQMMLDMEEFPNWFHSSHFAVTQLIPVRKLSSRSAEALFNSDTISYHQNIPTNTFWQSVHSVLRKLGLEGLATTYLKLPPKQKQQEIITRRVWLTKENGQCCLLMLPEKPELVGYQWTCYLFSQLERSRITLTHATVVTLPADVDHSDLEGKRLSFQLCSLRENVVFKKLGVYGKKKSRRSPVLSDTQRPNDVTKPKSILVNKCPPLSAEMLPPTLPDVPEPADEVDAAPGVKFDLPSVQPTANSKYDSLVQQSIQRLMDINQGTEANGWTHMGVTKDIEVMKRAPLKGEVPYCHAVKGKGWIRASPEFVLKVLLNQDNSKRIDELLKEVQLIEGISDFVQVGRLMYKAVWPTTARDFVVVSYCIRTDATTRIRGAFSVTHPDAPEDSNYVRGELVAGGYIIKDCPDNPAKSEVTYISQSDVKGNIPTMVVNKAMNSQPMCVSRLRNLVEPLYSNPHSDPTAIKATNDIKVPPPFKVPEKSNEIPTVERESPIASVTSTVTGNRINASMNNMLYESGGWELVHEEPAVDIFMDEIAPVSTTLNVSSHNNKQPNGLLQNNDLASNPKPSDSKPSPPHSTSPVLSSPDTSVVRTYTPTTISSEEEGTASEPNGDVVEVGTAAMLRPKKKHAFNAPDLFKDTWKPQKNASDAISIASEAKITADVISYPMRNSKVDFRTMGNQAAAELLQEVFYTSAVDVRNMSTWRNLDGGWKYQSYEKNIVTLQKKHSDSPFHSLMGKGIIEMTPDKVYEALRNPRLRYTYDNLLKSMDFVKKIDDDLYILYMMLETTQCFLKKARDLCILISERSEKDRDMIAGVSVSIPECPLKPNLNRARVFSSGWVVEPVEVHKKNYSSVTYLLQVDFGGVPARLVNYVSKRQPLAIAYLREYLLGA